MSIFNFTDYRKYLADYIKKQPRAGRGEISSMAAHLNVQPTLMSLVLSEQRELSTEQGFLLSNYLKLTKFETEYFSWMIQHGRASNPEFQEFTKSKLEELRTEAKKVVKRYPHEKSLSEEERTQFYSSWLFSAIRLFTSTKESGLPVEEIVARFQIPRQRVMEILEFLLRVGLVTEEDDKYRMGPQRTFVEHGSPHVLKHHTNWRLKALQQAENITAKELMFTTPISISKKDFENLREELVVWLKHFSETVKDSPAEEVACLNIDFFWIGK